MKNSKNIVDEHGQLSFETSIIEGWKISDEEFKRGN